MAVTWIAKGTRIAAEARVVSVTWNAVVNRMAVTRMTVTRIVVTRTAAIRSFAPRRIWHAVWGGEDGMRKGAVEVELKENVHE